MIEVNQYYQIKQYADRKLSIIMYNKNYLSNICVMLKNNPNEKGSAIKKIS